MIILIITDRIKKRNYEKSTFFINLRVLNTQIVTKEVRGRCGAVVGGGGESIGV
jgi:hypothetical protein